jgi:hypothetical protein
MFENDFIIQGALGRDSNKPQMDFLPKKSASFGDFSANLLKRKPPFYLNSIFLVEGNKTDFSIVAPRIDPNELCCSQSELDILGRMRDKDIGQRSLYLKTGGNIGPEARDKLMCANCRHFEREYYVSESQRISLQQEVNRLNDTIHRMRYSYQHTVTNINNNNTVNNANSCKHFEMIW